MSRRRWRYTWYGAVYLLLQLVPILSMLFLLTAAVSSALWAADLEHDQRQHETRLVQEAEYRDDLDESSV